MSTKPAKPSVREAITNHLVGDGVSREWLDSMDAGQFEAQVRQHLPERVPELRAELHP